MSCCNPCCNPCGGPITSCCSPCGGGGSALVSNFAEYFSAGGTTPASAVSIGGVTYYLVPFESQRVRQGNIVRINSNQTLLLPDRGTYLISYEIVASAAPFSTVLLTGTSAAPNTAVLAGSTLNSATSTQLSMSLLFRSTVRNATVSVGVTNANATVPLAATTQNIVVIKVADC